MGEMIFLKDIRTCYLVDELKRREGVEVKTIEPHTDTQISVHGPAVVLVVTD